MATPPILFLVFNRPIPTAQVLARIRAAKPARLFIAADGPRPEKPGEDVLCEQTRQLVDQGIDWECRVERLYRTANRGCKLAVSEAISWFFKEVEEGIVLEDDCLPDPTFFHFCGDLLQEHRNNPKVMHIGGFNPIANRTQPSASASYSYWHFGSIWGWATWRRAWDHYDVAMRDWPDFVRQERMLEHCQSPAEAAARTRSFNEVFTGAIDTWDFQWAFARILHRGLSITPSHNLISNIGFGADATHTHNTNDRRSRASTSEMTFPLHHPPGIEPDRVFGARYWEGIREQGNPTPRRSLAGRILSKIRRVLGWTSKTANTVAGTVSAYLATN